MALAEITALLQTIAWPTAILISAFVLRSPLVAFVHILKNQSNTPNRSLRLKAGGFELESSFIEKAQERIEQIANEPSLDKRLELAKRPLLIDEALKSISKEELNALKLLKQQVLVNACLINWYHPMDGVTVALAQRLNDLGLISSAAMYDGDEVAQITPIGLGLLSQIDK